jgi:ribosomal protein L14E/L6E/L27E
MAKIELTADNYKEVLKQIKMKRKYLKNTQIINELKELLKTHKVQNTNEALIVLRDWAMMLQEGKEGYNEELEKFQKKEVAKKQNEKLEFVQCLINQII